jgi:hypothetical protein
VEVQLNLMRKLIYAVVVAAPLVIACQAAGAEATNKALTFYILSEGKIDGGRFIDTAAIPKAGYIAAKPDLIVTNLQDVFPQKSAGYSIMFQTNGDHTVVSNTPRPAISLILQPEDAKRFAAITQQAVGKRMLVMLGDKPLTAPLVMAPIETGNVAIEFGREFGGQAEVKRVEDELKKLVR